MNRALIICLSLLCSLGATVAKAATCTGPAPAANGSQFYVGMNGSGFAVLWYCKTGNGWEADGFWGHWDELAGDWLYQVPKLLYGTDADRNALRAAEMAKPQTRDYTNTVKPLFDGLIAQYAMQYPPPVVAVVSYRVPPQSATVLDRQVYKANVAGTAVGTAITGVRVPQFTPCGPALGATNYRSVAGQKDTQGRVIAAGYAICQLVQ